ncbi:hypothetical protein GK047_20520 [Paenibacillus sp. SYP-B3998]|uniref:Uncharacterized protein n=1 Tax=Paenibacillus sp. SYP-B3998 TaxID=2678564 RepID=A0A6G4A1X7_9BACL|nr:hypothetical protein [Paenibacillus sp. SYP-B3998]NEW08385.1 hypothetical protein [Paenibacillus sp. SYP-B3998]
MVVLFIIILSGFLLHLLLQPPVDTNEEDSKTTDIFAELHLNSVSVPAQPQPQQALTTNLTKEE